MTVYDQGYQVTEVYSLYTAPHYILPSHASATGLQPMCVVRPDAFCYASTKVYAAIVVVK